MTTYVNEEEALKRCEALPKLYREAMRLLIKEMPSVESCKDAVSREWLLNEFIAHAYDIIYDTNSHEKGMSLTGIKQVIESAPLVTAETDIDDYMKGYDHGTADTWKIAQTVFGSTVTLYEAMDVAKCMKGSEDEHDK